MRGTVRNLERPRPTTPATIPLLVLKSCPDFSLDRRERSDEHILMTKPPDAEKLWQNVREIPTAARTVHPREFHAKGASINPANRFEALHFEEDPHDEIDEDSRPRKTIYYRDGSQSIIARNNSPDVGFETSVNPYRGCEHGCVYCYARPTHEYLGFSAGTDFESRIMVKIDAPKLLEAELSSRKWRPQVIAISGVTDPYQPIERKLEITRGCLRVLAKFRNPVGIITKNRLVTRDADLLGELANFPVPPSTSRLLHWTKNYSECWNRERRRPRHDSTRSANCVLPVFRLG